MRQESHRGCGLGKEWDLAMYFINGSHEKYFFLVSARVRVAELWVVWISAGFSGDGDDSADALFARWTMRYPQNTYATTIYY